MDVRIEQSWKSQLAAEWDKQYFINLTSFVREQYSTRTVFPPASKIFAAFDACPFDTVKVIILGQDPYHDVGQANGLCFSVSPGTPMPPSLVNIFREIHDDTGAEIPSDGDLSRWAKQGVLLLNSTLTVEAHRAGSHQGRGWEEFTDEVVMRLAKDREHLVFMLWGSYAIKKGAFIDRSRHMVLTSPHPSPLSAYRGFFGNHHFSQANAYLSSHGQTPIIW
jgi:uracil-DNA glycosylase